VTPGPTSRTDDDLEYAALLCSPGLLVLKATRGWAPINIRELWVSRELLLFFVWRDIKVRYKQTVLGVLWAIVQPLSTMLVFTIFLGWLARVPSGDIPYPLLVLTGLVPWTFFASGLTQSANSLVSAQNLITKIYFPRLLVPVAALFSGLIDVCLAFAILLAVAFAYGYFPTLSLIWAPFFLLLGLLTALGAGLWFSALNVEYRDVRYIVPFLTQLWMFVSPVVYPASLVPARWLNLYALNPMAGCVAGFRWAILGGTPPPAGPLLISLVGALVLVVTGTFYFRRVERTFADVV
jgi:lipopolysaccharide transport system permease protein